jgi:two-component system phosphate regulon sensor histidine kinase PhoR
MPNTTGLELLEKIGIKNAFSEAIMLTGSRDLSHAKKALQLGAFDYVNKPFSPEELINLVQKAMEMVQLKKKSREHLSTLEETVKIKTAGLEDSLRVIGNKQLLLDAILNSMDEGLLALDNDNTIVLLNSSAQKIIGRGAGTGQPLAQSIFYHQIRPGLLSRLGDPEQLKTGFILSVDYPETRETRFWSVHVSNFTGLDGIKTGKIVLFVEQTGKLKSELLQNTFLSTVAHELRTPLVIFFNYLALIKLQCPESSPIIQAVADMELTVRRLRNLVDTVVNLAKVSSPEILSATETARIADVVDAQIIKLSGEALEKNVLVSLENNANANEYTANGKLFGLAVNSLISNAIKFNQPKGTVFVAVQNSILESKPAVAVKIRDNGPGLPPDHSLLFQSFTQGDGSLTRRHGGLGLGLYLAQRSMDLLRGRLTFSTIPGQGTEFVLEIPVTQIETATPDLIIDK